MISSDFSDLTIGILAIQGAVEEHAVCLKKLGAQVKLIKLPLDMEDIDGIILPGGESTAMAIVGEEYGLFHKLKEWVHASRPIWGTCAGMVLLSDYAIKQREGGQTLVGGLDVYVCRNFFGPQINSRKIDLMLPDSAMISSDSSSFPAVFIRAPAIIKVGPSVTKIAEIVATPHRSAVDHLNQLLSYDTNDMIRSSDHHILTCDDEVAVTVAVQQHHILATAFHPELTNDDRFHRYFLHMVKMHKDT